MSRLRTSLIVVTVAAAGIATSLLIGGLEGMGKRDLLELVVATLPSLAGTVVAAVIAQPLLARASIVWRMVTIAAVAAVVSLANLIIASRLMFVSSHDAQVLGILVAFSVAAGIGTAFALSRSSRAGIEKLMATVRRLGNGDLSARVGEVQAEPELRTLAGTLDDMAGQLARSIEHERAVESMRRDLFTAVSHDLRTPLSSIKAIADALEEGVIEEPREMRRYVREMGTAVDSLTKMVDDLFELVQAGPDEVGSVEGVTFGSVLESVLKACEVVAREKGIAIRAETDGAKNVVCSPRLERVLQNLLVNSIRHTESGDVVVSAHLDESALVIEVTDPGEGMAEWQLPLVFEPFWRGDAARSSPGSGLGLTLAKRIVEHLGGVIEVTSRLGEGSHFTVRVPQVSRGT
jgi:signal transduction histidine kinase